MDYVQLGGFLLNYVFRYVMMMSTMQLKLLNCLFCHDSTQKGLVHYRGSRILWAQRKEMVFLPIVFASVFVLSDYSV